MQFRVLGSIEVSDGDALRPIPPGRQVALLALLLVHANRVVSTDRILDELWGDDPPDSGAKTVGFHVSRLRDALAPDRARNGRAGDTATALRTVDGGYLLHVDGGALDAARFERLATEGRALLAADPKAASDRLAAALAEWRGPAYAQVADEPFAQAEVARLEDLRLRAVEDSFDAALALGRHADVVAALAAHVEANPLREHARASLMTALYRAGRQAEALRAYADGRTILAEELGIEPGPELRQLERLVLEQDPRLDPPVDVEAGDGIRNPYKGLRPFVEADAADFFGRETLVAALLDRLGQLARGSRLLLLIGPSGSGKSSVALAGIVPGIRRGAVPSLADAAVEVLVPGSHPERELTAAVERLRLEARSSGVLVVDQLDEVPAVAGETRTEAFLHGLEEALSAVEPPLVAIVTLRADRIDLPLSVPGLAGRVRAGTEVVPPLSRADLERAVGRPAERVGLRVEPGLAQAIAADVGTQPGALPLLQVALTGLFERRDGDRLTRAAYEASGGVTGALATRAEDAWAALDRGDRGIARHLFLDLVAIAESGEPAGRRRRRVDVGMLADDPASLDRVVDALTRRRLLATDQDATTGEAVVAIAHDALLTHWPRLAGWIREMRDDLAMRRRLADATSEWEAAGRDGGFLLTGSRLDLFAAWASTTSLRLDPHERTLLDASLADRRAAEAAELARTGRERRLERRAATRLRALAAVLAAGIIVASGLSIALYRQGETAVAEARVAVARERAAASIGALGSDPRLSLLLAWHAADATADLGFVTEEAYDALHWSLQALHATYPAGGTVATAVRMGPNGPAGVPLLAPDELTAMAAAQGLRPLGPLECRTYLHQASCSLPPAPAPGDGPGPAVLRGGRTDPVTALATESLAGTMVDVVSQLPVDVATPLSSLVSRSGIAVRTTTDDAAGSVLSERLANGSGPDLVILAAPRTMADLAAAGRLVDLSPIVADLPQVATGSAYLDSLALVGDDGTWPSLDGRRRGVPVAITDESLLWTASGEPAPAAAPASWDDVVAVTRDAAAQGRAGWCLGLEGGAAGIDDLLGVFEDGLLDIGGTEAFDAWGAGSLLSTDRPAKQALARAREVADPSLVYGGVASAQLTPPAWAAWPMFTVPSPCVYHPGGGRDRLDWPAGIDEGLTAIAVPGSGRWTHGPVRGRVYVAVMLHDRPEVRAVLRSMLEPSSGPLLDDAFTGAGLWRPGGSTGPQPERDLLAIALRDGTFRARLVDIVPAPVREAMALGLATYAWGGDASYPLFTGGVRQAWAGLPIDGGE